MDSQETPHSSPLQARVRASFLGSLGQRYSEMSRAHCISVPLFRPEKNVMIYVLSLKNLITYFIFISFFLFVIFDNLCDIRERVKCGYIFCRSAWIWSHDGYMTIGPIQNINVSDHMWRFLQKHFNTYLFPQLPNIICCLNVHYQQWPCGVPKWINNCINYKGR